MKYVEEYGPYITVCTKLGEAWVGTLPLKPILVRVEKVPLVSSRFRSEISLD